MRKILIGFIGIFIVVVAVFCLILRGCGPAIIYGPEGSSSKKPEPIYNPLNNEQLTAEPEQLYIVSIDNNPSARPASGLTFAELVYEVPAEGGISRYLMFFYGHSAEKIGPVRSARPYMVDIAREWQGAFIHCGGSEAAYDYLRKQAVPSLNEIYNSPYFYRDKSRRAPHNLYTDTELLAKAAGDKGWSTQIIPHWQFADAAVLAEPAADGAAAEPTAATEITIRYKQAGNTYQYDEPSGLYLRSLGGKPQIDAQSERQVKVKNILVQEVSSRVLDSEGRLAIDLTAGGRAWYFVSGTVQEGSWQRASLSEPTVFLGADGQPWQLQTGNVWIQLIDQNVKFTY